MLIITCVAESHTKICTLHLAGIGTGNSSVQVNFRRNTVSERHVLSKLILDKVLEHEGFPPALKRV
jgi:hypothetical protein